MRGSCETEKTYTYTKNEGWPFSLQKNSFLTKYAVSFLYPYGAQALWSNEIKNKI